MRLQPTVTQHGSSQCISRRLALPAFVTLWFALFPQPAMAQGSLINGGNHSGSISTPGEIDEWTFTAAQGDRIALSVGEVFVSETDPGFNPWIRLFDPNGAQVASNTGALAAQINLNAPLSGAYTVLVRDSTINRPGTATGSYLLHFVKVPGEIVVPAGDHGGPLTNGGNHPGHIHVGDLDPWTFQASQGDFISLTIGEVIPGEVDPGFNPWIRLFDPNGTQVGSNTGVLAAQINVNASLSGTYTVLVADSNINRPGSATGSYLLHFVKAPGAVVVPDGDHGGPLTNGGNHPGAIHVGDVDPWTFQAAQGDRIALSIGEVIPGEVDPGFNPWIRLIGPTGAVVGSNTGALAAQINVNAPLSGTYTVLVADSNINRPGSATGNYLLHFVKAPGDITVPAGDHGGPLVNGGNHPGAIHVGDLDPWTFQAAQNDRIALSIGEVIPGEVDPGFNPWIRLIGPNGQVVGSHTGPLAAQINVNAPLSGTYTVLVADSNINRPGSAAGSYLLHFVKTPGDFVVPPGDEGGPMTNGVEHPGVIHVGDLDPWSFHAAQGAALTVGISEVIPGEVDPGFNPWIRLLSPTGAILGSATGTLTAQITVNAPLTGRYTVLVADSNINRPGSATGQYLVRVLGATDVTTVTVTPSAGPNGTISPSTPQTVTSGATVAFTVTPAEGHVIQSVGGTCGGTLTGQVFTTAAVTANCTVVANFAPATAGPTMSLDKSALYFAAVTDGVSFLSQTSAQIVRLTQSGAGTVTWTAASNQPWLTVSPVSGSGSADLSIAVAATGGLPIGGSVTGFITLSLTGAGNTAGPIEIVLTTLAPGTSENPFGVIDTPFDHGTGISGAVPFTGWGLDDVEVEGVMICRAAVGFESAPVDPKCGGAAQIFIGDAVFIDGARPDVQAGFPTYPRNSRAGWGFMVLTNMLPDVARGLPTGGNGTFVFYIYARDREGQVTLMGTRTLTCDNEHATKPFGAIDTPGQGAVVSGSQYVNFGWALTPNPKFIPTDGSTIQVFVDGVALGNVSYNHFRPDIAGFFPGLANSDGAVGFRIIDTTALANGVHTIAWSVTDNEGATEGIGSRYFTVLNGEGAATIAAAMPAEGVSSAASLPGPEPDPGELAAARARDQAKRDEVAATPLDRSSILGRRGWDDNAAPREYAADVHGRVTVRGEELDRIELRLSETLRDEYSGYLRVGRELAPLPIGSQLNAATGQFTWQPGVGFAGTYDLVFVRSSDGRAVARQEVRIMLQAKSSGRLGPQVVIDTPAWQQDVGQPFMLAGWAADLNAEAGTGIGALHVWAYPLTGEPPIFLGLADQGGHRPDVADLHGGQFRDAGYGLVVQGLVPGHYDIAVFAWSTVSGSFVPAKVVHVTVR